METHYNLRMHLAAINFGEVGSISCIVNQNEFWKNFTCHILHSRDVAKHHTLVVHSTKCEKCDGT